MYLTAQRIQRIKGKEVDVGIDVGINAFLYRHEAGDLPEDTRFDEKDIVEQITQQNLGKLVAESIDLVPGGNSGISFVDIVGRESLDKERIREFLDQMEPDIEGLNHPITKSAPDIAVKFAIPLGLQGNEIREYKALTERAVRLFESPEPPKWRTETPWIVICRKVSGFEEVFSVEPETAEKLKQLHGASWVSARLSIEHHIKWNLELMHGDLINHIAPILTNLSLEQIATQGGLILRDQLQHKKIKWPELKEI